MCRAAELSVFILIVCLTAADFEKLALFVMMQEFIRLHNYNNMIVIVIVIVVITDRTKDSLTFDFVLMLKGLMCL